MKKLKLGLIGVGISKSRAPDLHYLAGQLCGIAVTYHLISLESAAPESFDEALSECTLQGYSGVNVTHPFKEQAAKIVPIRSEQVRKLGAINTIRFDSEAKTEGFNSDYTGFKRAFESQFPGQFPGKVAIVGVGGVGRAIAFGLADLRAEEIRLFDQERQKSENLAMVLKNQTESKILICNTLEDSVINTDGLVNATHIGMHHHPGTPIPKDVIGSQRWAFDAVYTPLETRFLLDAREAGLEVLSGYELFFFQGVDAFEIFSGTRIDEALLRKLLSERP